MPIQAITLLRSTRLFRPLPGPQLEAVERRSVWETHPAETTLIREGDIGDRYYVLASGVVDVDQGGQRLRTIDARGEGFGEIALLRDVPRTATVTTTVNAMKCQNRAVFSMSTSYRPVIRPAARRASECACMTKPVSTCSAHQITRIQTVAS